MASGLDVTSPAFPWAGASACIGIIKNQSLVISFGSGGSHNALPLVYDSGHPTYTRPAIQPSALPACQKQSSQHRGRQPSQLCTARSTVVSRELNAQPFVHSTIITKIHHDSSPLRGQQEDETLWDQLRIIAFWLCIIISGMTCWCSMTMNVIDIDTTNMFMLPARDPVGKCNHSVVKFTDDSLNKVMGSQGGAKRCPFRPANLTARCLLFLLSSFPLATQVQCTGKLKCRGCKPSLQLSMIVSCFPPELEQGPIWLQTETLRWIL